MRGSRSPRRTAPVGAVGAALLAILFFRLWDLEVADGHKYLAEARNNRTRSTEIPAPRGKILLRDG